MRECLTALKKKYSGLEAHLFDENGNLFKHFNLFVNNKNISNLVMWSAIDGG